MFPMFRVPARPHTFRVLSVAAALALLAVACGPALLAPDSSTITLSASPTSITVNGVATITAKVVSASGDNVENETAVNFETTFGVISPAQSHTTGGQASTRLSGQGHAGTATVVAVSGSNRSESVDVVIGGSLSVTLTFIPASPAVNDQVTFTATPASSGPSVDHYLWNFGDPDRGTLNTKTTTTGSASYTYVTAGSKTVTVQAVATDGTNATAQTTVVVR